jgi:hypothetical protein
VSAPTELYLVQALAAAFFAAVVALVAVAIADLLYVRVETPMTGVGRKLIKKLGRTPRPSGAVGAGARESTPKATREDAEERVPAAAQAGSERGVR